MTTPTRTIEITVSPAGATSIKTSGFSGSTCKDATRELERALGATASERLLPEFYSRTGNSDRVQQGQ
jgi:hypothetical protein